MVNLTKPFYTVTEH